MNAQAQPAADFLHLARSSFIDAFAAVERSVCARLQSLGAEAHGSFGQRMEVLRAIEASPRYSKADRGAVHQHLEKLEKLNAVRCDVVHSQLYVVRTDGEIHSCFINPSAREEFCSTARVVSNSQFEAMTKELGRIAKGLAPR